MGDKGQLEFTRAEVKRLEMLVVCSYFILILKDINGREENE